MHQTKRNLEKLSIYDTNHRLIKWPGYGQSLIFKIKMFLYVHIDKPNINTFDDQNLVTKNVIALFNFKPK